MNIKKWIIRADKPFKGYTQSYLGADGKVAYSGKSFEEYNKEHNGKMKLITDAQLGELVKAHDESLQKPWQEMTKEDYWEQYECLPPIYKSPFWFISEATTSSLHSCYIEHNGKYYTALRCIYTRTEDLWADFKKDLQKL